MSDAVTFEDLPGGPTDVGESSDEVICFKDANGQVLSAASFTSLVFTLMDETTLAVINSRNATDVLNDNGGTVASDGTLTLRLDPADNVNVNSTAVGTLEHHLLLFAWTWSDGVHGTDRTGIQVFRKAVNPIPVAVP